MKHIKKMITDPTQYFHGLGNLHDARILWMNWNKQAEELSILVDDVQSNFLDTPEYRGSEPAMLYFRGVAQLVFDVELVNGDLGIYALDASPHSENGQPGIDVAIRCAPDGDIRCQCRAILIEKTPQTVSRVHRKQSRRRIMRENQAGVMAH